MTWRGVPPRRDAYGSAHDKTRKQWAARHKPTDPCVRCGHPLGPMGPGLHLDHHDTDKTIYLGFSHGSPCHVCGKRCNLVAAATLGARKRWGDRPPKRAPRAWPT